MKEKWLDWIIELQALAQNGLHYTKDVYDKERFERIREITCEMISLQSDLPLEKVKTLFAEGTGYQTPKLDTRGAIIQNNQILLIKEKPAGTWALPGGWVEVNQTIKENTEKEVKEEAGLKVEATKIVALQERNRHNLPKYAYNICKVFVLCKLIEEGPFPQNPETSERKFFDLENLPTLAEEKNTKAQIALCFKAYHSPHWQVPFD